MELLFRRGNSTCDPSLPRRTHKKPRKGGKATTTLPSSLFFSIHNHRDTYRDTDRVCNKNQQSMCEVKEPRIMLFGQTIQPHQHPPSSSHSLLRFITDEHESRDQNLSVPKQDHAKEEDLAKPLTSKESKDSSATGPILEDSNTPSADTNAGSLKATKSEEDQNETSELQEKTLKKPDRILPCPRCNSMDTKFCYFNNYNVNQPRHFCKNCQRYWTAGGTMRNVPVGAGRRKNKNYVSQFHPALSHSGTVLTFGSDSPLSESMSSVLSIVDKTVGNGAMDSDGGNRDDHSSSKDEGPCYPGGPWPYPWNSVQWNSSAFYSTMTPYWGCAMPGTWPVPWVFPRTQSSGPTLGKHSRDDTYSEKSVWVLKTSRVDDSGEAEKSCISATLGIKKDRVDSIGGGGLFKAIESQSKSGEKARVQETSSVLQANPAALSRSLSFHESS